MTPVTSNTRTTRSMSKSKPNDKTNPNPNATQQDLTIDIFTPNNNSDTASNLTDHEYRPFNS
uniref:Uncharacterized protein n=1 Tax=Rhizophagus irregularis (strain DAOM 181602 / DAOM 197198 / MUCL 43194) TaxID=747089 RepID=U9TMX7_RHIID